MNGYFIGGVGKEGIGGVFRDSDGTVLLQFCKEISVESLVHADCLHFTKAF